MKNDMKDILTYIILNIASKECSRITEADSNPEKWYELFITREDGSTESVESADTFKEVIINLGKYIPEYRFDRVNIDIWENKNEKPENIYAFFSAPIIYPLIYDYLRRTGQSDKMRFVGTVFFPEDGSVPKYTSDYDIQGAIFIDEIAFDYFHDLCCYIPECDDVEELNENMCTYNDFMEIAKGDIVIARNLFKEVSWEHPSTIYEGWEADGVLDEDDENKCSLQLEKLVLTRFKTLEEIKEKITSLIGMDVTSIEEDDMSCHDDKSTGFIQADFSMTLDIDTNTEKLPNAILTLFYYKDRQDNYVIVETSFAFE